MPARDLNGKPYATPQNVSPGTQLICDGGFTCLAPGRKRLVKRDDKGLFVKCLSGKHYLDGQLKGRGANEHYVGFYLAKQP